MSRTGVVKDIKEIKSDLANLTQSLSELIDAVNILTQEVDPLEGTDDFIIQQLSQLSSDLSTEVSRIEDIANYKEFRFAKPTNYVFELSSNMSIITLDMEHFDPNIMEVRVDGEIQIHKDHSPDHYTYWNNGTVLYFTSSLKEGQLLWVHTSTTLELDVKINKEYLYEDYINAFGQESTRLKTEIWTGDFPKRVDFVYDTEIPHRIIKEVVTRAGETYERTFTYNDNQIVAQSDSGVDDFFVYKIYGSQMFDRKEIAVENLTNAIIKHDLGITYPFVQVWQNNKLSFCDIAIVDDNTIEINTYDDPISGVIIVRR